MVPTTPRPAAEESMITSTIDGEPDNIDAGMNDEDGDNDDE